MLIEIVFSISSITLTTPVNKSVVANIPVILNITVSENNNAQQNVTFYGSNNKTFSNIIARFENVPTNSVLAYNWTAMPVQTNSSDNSLVSIWHLDGNASDSYGRNTLANSGVSTPKVFFNNTGGYLGGGVVFNASGVTNQGFLSGAVEAGINNSAQFTIAAWVRFTSLYAHETIWSISDNAAAAAYFQFGGLFNSPVMRPFGYMRQAAGDKWLGRGQTNLSTNTWYHLAITKNDSADAVLYVNGTVETMTFTVTTDKKFTIRNMTGGLDNVTIGDVTRTGNPPFPNPFNGTIDEVVFFNRTLTAVEILDLYRLKNDTYFWSINVTNSTGAELINDFAFFVGADSVKPSVAAVVPSSGSSFNTGTIIELAVNVSDNSFIDVVYANLTDPASLSTIITLVATGAVDSLDFEKYNNTFLIPATPTGTYSITYFSNDTSNNINSSITSSFTATAPLVTPKTGNAYHQFFGLVAGDIILGLGSKAFYNWSSASVRNVYSQDTDSVVNLKRLIPLGYKKDNVTLAANDFEDLDVALNMTGFNESINITFSNNGSNIKFVYNISLFENSRNVPVVNSSNSSTFVTGILWDSSDDSSGNSEFDSIDLEDIVFVAPVNKSKPGGFDTRQNPEDYELKVPQNLTFYKGATNTLTFLLEMS